MSQKHYIFLDSRTAFSIPFKQFIDLSTQVLLTRTFLIFYAPRSFFRRQYLRWHQPQYLTLINTSTLTDLHFVDSPDRNHWKHTCAPFSLYLVLNDSLIFDTRSFHHLICGRYDFIRWSNSQCRNFSVKIIFSRRHIICWSFNHCEQSAFWVQKKKN